jgi:hypothetical protein
VTVDGWCGHCGEGFRLAQVVTEGAGGRCPRCGIVFSHEYNAVVTATVAEAIRAADALFAASQKLAETAPLLHIDREALYKSLDEFLDR